MKAVAAAEANRNFSKLLKQVRAGESVVITAHGEPVARLIPASEGPSEREKAMTALLRRLSRAVAQDRGPLTRANAYDA